MIEIFGTPTGENVSVVGFEINCVPYVLKLKEIEDKNQLGICDCKKAEIIVCNTMTHKTIYKTLLHELTHAYLYEYGHNRNDFSQEDICNIFSAFGEDIVKLAHEIKTKLETYGILYLKEKHMGVENEKLETIL